VLFDPAGVFHELARDGRARGGWWHRPLVFLLAFGAFVSILASGRFSARLIVDGAVSFAFVPAIGVATLAIVSRTWLGRPPGGRPSTAFARDVDVFFIGNAPWLLWMVVVGAVFGVVAPRHLAPWVTPAIWGCAIPIAWSAWIDYQFFREILQQPPRGALRALVVHRVIAWAAMLGVFFGIAVWGEIVPQVVAWFGL
jgi:hypothetical protein